MMVNNHFSHFGGVTEWAGGGTIVASLVVRCDLSEFQVVVVGSHVSGICKLGELLVSLEKRNKYKSTPEFFQKTYAGNGRLSSLCQLISIGCSPVALQ